MRPPIFGTTQSEHVTGILMFELSNISINDQRSIVLGLAGEMHAQSIVKHTKIVLSFSINLFTLAAMDF